MHATTGHWQRGLLLASITAVCWGVLPIALKHLLEGMDALTVTWYRLASAAVTVGLFLAWRGALPRRPRVADGTLWLCILATGALAGNYVLYLLSLELTTPTVAQVVAQVSPLCLLFADIVPLYQVILTAWMYLTPIFYPLSIVPEPYRVLVEANPMTYFVEAFRAPIYAGSLPAPSVLLGATASAAFVFLGGAVVFNRYSDRIAYHV